MNEPNTSVFHCVTCGRIAHVPFGATPPQCCGKLMAKAFDETIPDTDTKSERTKAEQELIDHRAR